MKNKILILLLLIQFPYLAQTTWIVNKDSIITYYYQDGDEFNEPTINIKKWKYWYGWGRSISHQKEQQYYTEGKNHILENGVLSLTAKKEKINAKLIDWLPDFDTIDENGKFDGINKRTFNYSGGMIQSEKKYKYGYFEIKFKISKESGFWPAFWLYGGNPHEEIDWMELKTEDVNSIHVGRHGQKREDNRVQLFFRKKWWGGNVYFKGNLTKGFNIISGEWTPEYIKYYLNGQCIAYTKIHIGEEKFLVANIAVPSNNGPFKPAPKIKNDITSNFEIDYIRIWSKETSNINTFPEYINIDKSIKNIPIEKTKLRSKSNFLYGKKSDHKNEGFIVSLVPRNENNFTLQVTGHKIPTNAHYTLKNKVGDVLKKDCLIYGETNFTIENYTETEIYFEINCFGKKINQTLFKK